jgi:hypothetical protein
MAQRAESQRHGPTGEEPAWRETALALQLQDRWTLASVVPHGAVLG